MTMGTLHEQIKKEVQTALKAKDALLLAVLRNMVAEFQNELVKQKRKPNEILVDTDALKVIKRLSNQRKDSIAQYIAGNRPELADNEKNELKILERYLPKMMDREEIKKVAVSMRNKLGIDDKSKKGQLIGALIKELQGKADGAEVNSVVEELLT